MFNWFKKKIEYNQLNSQCIGIHPILSKRSPTDQDNKGVIPGISFWIKDDRSEFWFYNMDSKWIKLNINQPERSKREDLNCDNCKIPRIFTCCSFSGFPPYHKNNESCDEYKFKMRCSEHCGNTVRKVQ